MGCLHTSASEFWYQIYDVDVLEVMTHVCCACQCIRSEITSDMIWYDTIQYAQTKPRQAHCCRVENLIRCVCVCLGLSGCCIRIVLNQLRWDCCVSLRVCSFPLPLNSNGLFLNMMLLRRYTHTFVWKDPKCGSYYFPLKVQVLSLQDPAHSSTCMRSCVHVFVAAANARLCANLSGWWWTCWRV